MNVMIRSLIVWVLYFSPVVYTFSQCSLAINLINATIVCDEETPNPDLVSLVIPYTGTDANFVTSVTVVSPPNAPTPIVGGDDPSSQPSGNIVISDMIEGGTYLISLMGQECNFGTLTYFIPDGTCGTVLPVELRYFSGRAMEQGHQVSLNWATSSELNADKFTIERSMDGGRTFSAIGELSAAGSTTVEQQYSWTDRRPTTGVNFYRLVQYDLDGSFTTYGPIAVEIEGQSDALLLYPNPTTSELNIRGYEYQIERLEIWNIQGQLVKTISVAYTDQTSFSVSDLQVGTYHIRALGPNGETLESAFFEKGQ